jgi:hypothetical protein
LLNNVSLISTIKLHRSCENFKDKLGEIFMHVKFSQDEAASQILWTSAGVSQTPNENDGSVCTNNTS